jgi:hypothetical protein
MWIETSMGLGTDGELSVPVNAVGEAFVSFEDTRLCLCYMNDPVPVSILVANLRLLADRIEGDGKTTAQGIG